MSDPAFDGAPRHPRPPSADIRVQLWLLCIAAGIFGLAAIGLGLRTADAQQRHQHLIARIALLAPSLSDGEAATPSPGWVAEQERLQSDLAADTLVAEHPALAAALAQWDAAHRAWTTLGTGEGPVVDADADGPSPASAGGDAPTAADAAMREAVASVATGASRLLLAHWSEAAASARERGHRWQALALTAFVIALLASALSIEPAVGAIRRERQRLQRAADEHARLALVARHTANSVAILDTDGRTTWVNDGFTRIWGWAPSEVVGRQPHRLLASDHTDPQARDAVEQAAAQGRPWRGALLLRGKDGVDRWVDVDLQPLRDADDRPAGAVAVATDITEHVRTQQQQDAILASVATAVLVFDRHGLVVECNPAAEQMFGRPRSDLLGSGVSAVQGCFVGDDLRPLSDSMLPARQALVTGRPLRAVALGMVRPDGELSWLLANAEPLVDASGRAERVVASFVDVSPLRRHERVLATTVEGAGLGLWERDLRTGATTCNARFARMLGWQPEDLDFARDGMEGLMHPEDRDRWQWIVEAHLKDPSQPCRMEMRLRRPDGDWAWATATGAVVERSIGGQPLRMAGVLIDMTEHMQMQAMLMHTARTDNLTQLPNRAQLMERLEVAVSAWHRDRRRPFALLYMDFDRFKLVNDTHGHALGDALLRQIAERLQGALRRGETQGQRPGAPAALPARISGDEFVVLLEGVDGLATAQAVAERLLVALGDPYVLGPGVRVHSSASIGIVAAEHCAADADVHSVMRDADTAMYEAKRAGRARAVVFDPSMHQALTRRSELEAELRTAIAAGQIQPAYQPIVALGDGAVVGVEALARWHHPQRGAISPVEFIPVAEDSGLIGALGAAMLEAACRDFVRWRSALGAAAPTTVAVNLSRAQLATAGIVDEVHHILQRTGIPPSCLQLEVTESMAGEESSVRDALHRLKQLGIALALDDFGTGYSSLACLHQMPVDSVKIDRSFVREAQDNEVHRVLIRATVQVAQALGMTIVAEGVETDGQAHLVASLGCSKAQGFLYSRPLLARDLETWLQARRLRAAA